MNSISGRTLLQLVGRFTFESDNWESVKLGTNIVLHEREDQLVYKAINGCRRLKSSVHRLVVSL